VELKENYTKADNVFFEYGMTLKPNEMKVLLYIIRNTVGYHRGEFETNYSKIGDACLIRYDIVKKAIDYLILTRIISIDKGYKHNFHIIYDREKAKKLMLDACV